MKEPDFFPHKSESLHEHNLYSCWDPTCAGKMYSPKRGRAVCQICGLRVGDLTQVANARSGEFDLIDCGPLRGPLPGDVVAEGLASRRADPADNPVAQAFRKSVDAGVEAVEAGQRRASEQLARSAKQRKAEGDSAEEVRQFLAQRRSRAAAKAMAAAQPSPQGDA